MARTSHGEGEVSHRGTSAFSIDTHLTWLAALATLSPRKRAERGYSKLPLKRDTL